MANILYFSTTWCGPCKMFKPVVQEVSAELGVSVQYIDAEQNSGLASKYSITSVPTIIVEEQGNVLHKRTGVLSKPQLALIFTQFR
jgi:thioredoxin 1